MPGSFNPTGAHPPAWSLVPTCSAERTSFWNIQNGWDPGAEDPLFTTGNGGSVLQKMIFIGKHENKHRKKIWNPSKMRTSLIKPSCFMGISMDKPSKNCDLPWFTHQQWWILQMNGGNRNEQEGIKPSSSWHVMVAPWAHDGDPPGGNQQYNMLC